ncbi:MAG: hypothetical protein LQ346_003871 [Caloplaca aetnensis]|nr:MAG: hypothetical protein LQ346_003871 [Caloplaca aetnensis]
MPNDRGPRQYYAFHPSAYRHDEYHEIKMSRPQDVYFDYNARQQNLRERARAPSSRPRKRWPPFPSVEDEVVSLSHELRPGPPDAGGAEAHSRGSLDQQPLILDVDLSTTKKDPQVRKEMEGRHRNRSASEESASSDESSGPETPTDTGSGDEKTNRDRRYVFIPQEGVEIPLTYDEPRTPIHAKPSESHGRTAPGRGRRNMPKLDTDLSRADVTHDVPVQLERERSPYRSTPKTKETRFSGEHLLSPEIMTPKSRRPESPSHHRSGQPQRASSINPGSFAELNDHRPTRSARPTMVRHASAMAYPGGTTAALNSPTQFGSTLTQRDAQRDAFSPVQRNSSRLNSDFPESPRNSSAFQSGHDRQQERPSKHHPSQENMPPSRTLPMSTDRAPVTPGPLPASVAHHSLNTGLSSPLFDRRQASPRNSPRSSPVASAESSPLSSPPRTPPAEAASRKVGYIDSVKTSGLNSKNPSPLHSPSASKPADHLNIQDKGVRGSRPAIRSRQTSPLPAVVHKHREPDPTPQIDVRSPSPSRHRRSSTSSGTDQRSRSQHFPENQTQGTSEKTSQTLRPAGIEHRRRSSSAVVNRPRLTIDSSHAQAGTELSQPRHLSPKSQSATRAASVGAPPAHLPPCPRSVPAGGHNDWYCLNDYPMFKVCPTCRDAVSKAGYGRHFIAAFTNSPERPVRCSFSIPWIRMAYLLMVKKRRSDVNLLYDMADVAEDTTACPGKRASTREWYRIRDVDSDRNVPGFYACPYCVRSLETIFPVLKGVFHKSRSRHSLEERACSLRSDSSRFATYVDLLEDTAKQADEYRRAPNTYRFVELAKKLGAIPTCLRDDMLRSGAWHIMPRLPEFTACSECYEDIVWPAVLQGLPLAPQFTKEPQVIEKPQVGVSCQMYSSKMRKVFLDACSDDDFDYLRKFALKRHRIERDLQKRIVEAQRLPRDEREMAMEDIVDEWQKWDE